MKLKDYITYGIIAILLSILMIQSCSKRNVESELVSQYKSEIKRLTQEKETLTLISNDLSKQVVELTNKKRCSQKVEYKYITKYIKTTDTIRIEKTDTIINNVEVEKEPGFEIEVLNKHFEDSLYTVTTGIAFKGELKSVVTDFTINKTPEVIQPIIIDNTKEYKMARLYITSELDFTSLSGPLNFNVGLMYQDRKFRQFGVSKTLNNNFQYQIKYNQPLLYSKIK